MHFYSDFVIAKFSNRLAQMNFFLINRDGFTLKRLKNILRGHSAVKFLSFASQDFKHQRKLFKLRLNFNGLG